MIKHKLLFILCLGYLPLIAQQSRIYGVISIHNSQTETGIRQFVTNAEVQDDFNKAQQSVSNERGQFELIYVGKPEKENVSFHIHNASLLGLEVVNIDALRAVTGQNKEIQLSMAPPNKIADYRSKIYNVAKTEAIQRLEALIVKKGQELTNLRKNNLQNGQQIMQLKQDLLQLEEKRNKVEENAKELARKYAPINLDDASPIFRDAFVLFQNGKLDSALVILTKVNLANMVYQILQEREKLANLQKEIIKRDTLLQQRFHDVEEALLFKADLHKTYYEFDSTRACYELLIELDSLNTDYIFYYAYFLRWLNQHDIAINYFLKILEIYKKDYKKYEQYIAPTLIYLGDLYREKKAFTKTETAYLEALKIYESLAVTKFLTYQQDIAWAQNQLGILYSNTNDFVKAEEFYLKSLGNYKQLAKTSLTEYDANVALSESNLGNFYNSINEYLKAEGAFLNSINIYKRLLKVEYKIYEPLLANVYNSLGFLYFNTTNYSKAESVYLEALNVFMRLANTNPQTYEPYLAQTQNNLGILYLETQTYPQAEKILLEASKIRNKLAIENSSYEAEFAETQNNLGILYYKTQNYNKAEVAYLKALEIRKRLAIINPQVFEPKVARTKMNIGVLYRNKNDFASSEVAFLESLVIYKRLSNLKPNLFEPDLALIQNNLGDLYLATKNYSKAEFFFIESLNVHERWMIRYPQIFTKSVNLTIRGLLKLYSNIIDSLKYESFKKGITDKFGTIENVLINHAKKDNTIAHYLLEYYDNRSWYLLFASKFKEAERTATNGLKIKSDYIRRKHLTDPTIVI